MQLFQWVHKGKLARGSRPGYERKKRPSQVGKPEVKKWLKKIRKKKIRSVICLLDQYHLGFYRGLQVGLISYYRKKRLAVEHISVRNRQHPPMSEQEMELVWRAYRRLPKPVLVHCSAGKIRTGVAISHLQRTLRKTAA
jgi:protein tyrosine/serine phosphatase